MNIADVKNYTGHGSSAQKSIWHCIMLLSRFEAVVASNDAKNITEMSQKLENNSKLFDWFCSKFPERLCKCRSNRAVIFGEEKRRICGLSNKAEIIDPSDNDVEKSIAIIKMFRML